jgi:MarR-like DNA-binding transcriptional regulator SgrR of sgrS sRNA
MTKIENYIRLYSEFYINENTSTEVTLKEVSDLLYCTDRNSKLILKKMEGLGWASWSPGRGRGNKSTIAFTVQPVDLIVKTSKDYVRNGEIVEARRLIEHFESHYPSVRNQFDSWFQSIFGLHEEVVGERKIDILRLKVNISPISLLDPLQANLRSECHLVKQVCDTLVRFNPKMKIIEPHLAFHWEVQDDSKKWFFYLRKGVLFHNGKELKAVDVEYTIKRAMTTQHPYHWMVQNIEAVKVMSEYVIMVQFNEPNHICLDILSDERLSIVPFHSNPAEGLIGTGPFQLVKLKNSLIELRAHHHYFRERPFLDVVELLNIEHDADEFYHDARFGLIPEVSPAEGWRQLGMLEWNVQYVSMNMNKEGPLQDSLLRQAIYIIICNKRLVNEVSGPRQEPVDSLLPEQEYKMMDYGDLKALLKKSTYKGEVLHLYTFQDEDHVEDVTWIVNECGKFGIIIKPHYVESDELLRTETIQSADLIHDSASLDEQLEKSFLQLFLAENSFVRHHLSTEDFHFILDKIRLLYQTEDSAHRYDILQGIDERCIQINLIKPLYRNRASIQTNEKVQEAILNSQGWVDFYSIWFKKES